MLRNAIILAERGAVIVVTASLLLSSASAESRYILGVPFEIDQLSDSGRGLSRVSACGIEGLVPVDGINDWVLSTCLTHTPPALPPPIIKFPSSQLKKLAIGLLEEGKVAQTSRVLLALYLKRDALRADREELQAAILRSRKAVAVAREFIREAKGWSIEPQIVVPMLLKVWSVDSDWVKNEILDQKVRFGEHYATLLEQAFFERVVSQEFDGARSVSELYGVVFPEERDRIVGMALFLGQVRGLMPKVEPIDEVLLFYRENKLFQTSLKPLLAHLCLKRLRSLEDDEDWEGIISTVSRYPFEERTPDIHEKLKNALSMIAEQPKRFVLSLPVRQTLVSYAAVDDGIRRESLRVLRRKIEDLLASAEFDTAFGYFTALVEINPDPSEANDTVRWLYLDSAVEAGKSIDSEQQINEVYKALSLSRRIRIRLKAIPVLGSVLWSLFLALVAGGGYAIFRYIRNLKTSVANTERFGGSLLMDEDSDLGAGSFVSRVPSESSKDLRIIEYERCLEVLGLSVDASLTDIKGSFRKIAKEEHPDAQIGQNQDGDSGGISARFIEAKKAYERILELEKDPGFRMVRAGRLGWGV